MLLFSQRKDWYVFLEWVRLQPLFRSPQKILTDLYAQHSQMAGRFEFCVVNEWVEMEKHTENIDIQLLIRQMH